MVSKRKKRVALVLAEDQRKMMIEGLRRTWSAISYDVFSSMIREGEKPVMSREAVMELSVDMFSEHGRVQQPLSTRIFEYLISCNKKDYQKIAAQAFVYERYVP